MELKIDGLTKKYKDKLAVNNVSLTLENGVYGLLGSNGAGKTTLMRMLCGILKPTNGEIKFNGIDVSTEKYRDYLGYLPQDFGYYPEFTAFEFLCYIATLKGLPKKYGKEKANELLKQVSLESVKNKKIKTFSGGMKRRLGIAQAIINNPKILILDEPTAGLDPKERVNFRNLISNLGKDRIVLLSTHIVSDVENIANTILMMKDGRIIHNGSLKEIISVIKNMVWECLVDNDTAQKLIQTYQIINLRQEQEQTFLRLVSDDKPCQNAINCNATLEDLYLFYFTGDDKNE